MPLYQIPYDKGQHVIYGAVVAVAAVMVLVAWNWLRVWLPLPRVPRAMIPLVAFAASFLVGWLYERWQELQNTRAVARNQPPPHNRDSLSSQCRSIAAKACATALDCNSSTE